MNVKYISKYSMKNIAFGQCDAQNLMSCTIIDYMLNALAIQICMVLSNHMWNAWCTFSKLFIGFK